MCSPSYTFKETLNGFMITIVCEYCHDKRLFSFTPEENINLRFQPALYRLGVGVEKSKRFVVSMDLPKVVSKNLASTFQRKANPYHYG